jgi:transcriptional antiterminator RfaH
VSEVGVRLTQGESIPEPGEGQRWVVVHTRPRCEKKIQSAARMQGYVVYLPLHSRTHRYGARVRTFESPLFPGYIFCLADQAGVRWLKQNRYSAHCLEVANQPQLVDQLRQLQVALHSGLLTEAMPYLEAGRRVRVQAGPLRGLEGLIIRVKGQTRMVLNVDMIRESVSVEVDSALLAPL